LRSPDQRLLRHIIVTLCIKLFLLLVLWQVFVRDYRVDVGHAEMQRALISTPSAPNQE
jgi:hypothetical protein